MEHIEHGDLTDRLRRLGQAPVDPDVATRHLGRLAATQPAGTLRLARVALVATAALILVAAPAAALVAAARDDGPDPGVPAGSTDEDRDRIDAEAAFSCTGPPPWAGEPATPADPSAGSVPSDRAAEAEAFSAWRDAHCPDDGTTTTSSTTTSTSTTTTTSTTTVPGDADGCTGPPPWAGEPATPANPAEGQVPSERAEEARDHAEQRQACSGDEGSDDVDDDADDGPGGPPAGVPGGPPTGRPGPPSDPGEGPGRGADGPRGPSGP